MQSGCGDGCDGDGQRCAGWAGGQLSDPASGQPDPSPAILEKIGTAFCRAVAVFAEDNPPCSRGESRCRSPGQASNCHEAAQVCSFGGNHSAAFGLFLQVLLQPSSIRPMLSPHRMKLQSRHRSSAGCSAWSHLRTGSAEVAPARCGWGRAGEYRSRRQPRRPGRNPAAPGEVVRVVRGIRGDAFPLPLLRDPLDDPAWAGEPPGPRSDCNWTKSASISRGPRPATGVPGSQVSIAARSRRPGDHHGMSTRTQ